MPIVALYLPGPEGTDESQDPDDRLAFIAWEDGTLLLRTGSDVANGTFWEGRLTREDTDRLLLLHAGDSRPAEDVQLFVDRVGTRLEQLYSFHPAPLQVIWDTTFTGGFAHKEYSPVALQEAIGLLGATKIIFYDLVTRYHHEHLRMAAKPARTRWLDWRHAARTLDDLKE